MRISTGHLSAIDKTSGQKINKDTENVNKRIKQHNQTDFHKTLYSTTEHNIFFSNAAETFNKRNHMLDHKANINILLKTEISERELEIDKISRTLPSPIPKWGN